MYPWKYFTLIFINKIFSAEKFPKYGNSIHDHVKVPGRRVSSSVPYEYNKGNRIDFMNTIK